MRFAVVLSLLLAAALYSCENVPAAKESSTFPAIDSTDEYSILGQVLDAEAGPDSSARRNMVPPPFPGEKDPQKIAQHRHWADSLSRVLDTMKLTLYIRPGTVSYESNNLKALLTPPLFAANFTGVDSAFIPLLRLMADSVRNRVIDLPKLKTNYSYSLAPAPLDYWKKRRGQENAGVVGFSSVYFDAQKQRACVYATYWCGELCGDGTIYFLEKKDGQWSIIGSRCMWVS
jgi:hypothetical protein